MSLKQLSLLLLAVGVFSFTAEAKKKKPVTSKEKPTIENVDWCVVYGNFQLVTEGENQFYVCYHVSMGKCYAVPCGVFSPYGPKAQPHVQQESVPNTYGIQPGQQYIVTYGANGSTTIHYGNNLQLNQTTTSTTITLN